jgi:hypothetical protein
MTTAPLRFEPLYPDVLSAITPTRVSYDTFQAAVGLFPRQVFLNQPLEVVIIAQSLIDQPQDIRLTLQLPGKDGTGKPMAFEAPQRNAALHLEPGEVLALRLPVAPVPPTQPGNSLPLAVTFQTKPPRNFRYLRAATGGAPPSELGVSPFKLLVLRDVHFAAAPVGAARETVRLAFDLNGRALPAGPAGLKPVVERLWTKAQYPAERDAVADRVDEARVLATTFTTQAILEPLFDTITDSFAGRGLPLHPGEALAIAKMLAYVVDASSAVDESAVPLDSLRWFQSLCQLLAADPQSAAWTPGALVTGPLFEAVLYDAVVQGFAIIRTRVKTTIGDKNERVPYANKLLGWFTGQSEPDQAYVYLPLVLAGVAVNALITLPGENPWELVDAVEEAARGRVRLASRNVKEVFDLLDKLIARASDDLRRERIQRP